MESVEVAEIERRIGAYFLDALVTSVVLIPFLLGMRASGALEGNPPDIASFYGFAIPALISAYGVLAYFEGRPGSATPGKMLVGIRVADVQNNGPIGYRRAVVRRIVWLIGALCFGVGWLWGLANTRAQTWHDIAAHSVVVDGPKANYSILSVVLAWFAIVGILGFVIEALEGQSIVVAAAIGGVATLALTINEGLRRRTG